jgi:hypothetical protein
MSNGNGGNRIVAYVFAIIFALGFAIVLSKALVLPFLILAFIFLGFGVKMESQDLFYISIILFIATAVAFVVGYVFGGTDIGQFAENFFNTTIHPY